VIQSSGSRITGCANVNPKKKIRRKNKMCIRNGLIVEKTNLIVLSISMSIFYGVLNFDKSSVILWEVTTNLIDVGRT
jgi:hypothetical protein